jgi:hypothetical protein
VRWLRNSFQDDSSLEGRCAKKRKTTIWAICFVAFIDWTGVALAQTATPAPMKTVKFSNGLEVFDISGEWDVLIENYGEKAIFGTYTNVAQITIKESDGSFHAVRMKANPPISPRPAGSLIMIGELDKNGITKLDAIVPERTPSTWQISENGNKINVDAPNKVRLTFTRK